MCSRVIGKGKVLWVLKQRNIGVYFDFGLLFKYKRRKSLTESENVVSR